MISIFFIVCCIALIAAAFVGLIVVAARGFMYYFDDTWDHYKEKRYLNQGIASVVGLLLLTTLTAWASTLGTDNSTHCLAGTHYTEWTEGSGKSSHTEWACEADR